MDKQFIALLESAENQVVATALMEGYGEYLDRINNMRGKIVESCAQAIDRDPMEYLALERYPQYAPKFVNSVATWVSKLNRGFSISNAHPFTTHTEVPPYYLSPLLSKKLSTKISILSKKLVELADNMPELKSRISSVKELLYNMAEVQAQMSEKYGQFPSEAAFRDIVSKLSDADAVYTTVPFRIGELAPR